MASKAPAQSLNDYRESRKSSLVEIVREGIDRYTKGAFALCEASEILEAVRSKNPTVEEYNEARNWFLGLCFTFTLADENSVELTDPSLAPLVCYGLARRQIIAALVFQEIAEEKEKPIRDYCLANIVSLWAGIHPCRQLMEQWGGRIAYTRKLDCFQFAGKPYLTAWHAAIEFSEQCFAEARHVVYPSEEYDESHPCLYSEDIFDLTGWRSSGQKLARHFGKSPRFQNDPVAILFPSLEKESLAFQHPAPEPKANNAQTGLVPLKSEDEAILQEYARSFPTVVQQQVIEINTGISRKTVTDRCKYLREHQLIERPFGERTGETITELGRKHIARHIQTGAQSTR